MNKSLFFGLVIFVMTGCKKETPPEENGYTDRPVYHSETHVNESLKAAFLFQPGSFWVYKNLQNGNRDSVFVNSIHDLHYGCSSGGPGGNFSHDDYFLRMNLSGAIETNQYYLVGSSFSIYFGTCAFNAAIFGYDPTSLSGVTEASQVLFYDSLLIENTWYYNVAKTKLNLIASPTFALFQRYNGSFYYINRDYGIVRKELIDKEGNMTILNLVNSQIIH